MGLADKDGFAGREAVRGNDGLARPKEQVGSSLGGGWKGAPGTWNSRCKAPEEREQVRPKASGPGAGRARGSAGKKTGTRSRPATVTIHAGPFRTKCALSLQHPRVRLSRRSSSEGGGLGHRPR